MRNLLHRALLEHLNQPNDPEKLHEYYTIFAEAETQTAETISHYADLIFQHGVNEDSMLSEIKGAALLGIGLSLQHFSTCLSLAQYGRERTSYEIDKLTTGASNEN